MFKHKNPMRNEHFRENISFSGYRTWSDRVTLTTQVQMVIASPMFNILGCFKSLYLTKIPMLCNRLPKFGLYIIKILENSLEKDGHFDPPLPHTTKDLRKPIRYRVNNFYVACTCQVWPSEAWPEPTPTITTYVYWNITIKYFH